MLRLNDIESISLIDTVSYPSKTRVQIAYRLNGEMQYTEADLSEIDHIERIKPGHYLVVYIGGVTRPRVTADLTVLIPDTETMRYVTPWQKPDPDRARDIDSVFERAGATPIRHRVSGTQAEVLAVNSRADRRIGLMGTNGHEYLILNDPIMLPLPQGSCVAVRVDSGVVRIMDRATFDLDWEIDHDLA